MDIFRYARYAARRSGHEMAGSGHLLLAISKELNREERVCLGDDRFDYPKLLAALYEILPPSEILSSTTKVLISPCFMQVEKAAQRYEDFDRLTDSLIWMLSSESSTAGAMLYKLGIDKTTFLRNVHRLQNEREKARSPMEHKTTDREIEDTDCMKSDADVLKHAAALLRYLSADIPNLRHHKAVRFLQTHYLGMSGKDEEKFLDLTRNGAKKEAAQLAKIAKALDTMVAKMAITVASQWLPEAALECIGVSEEVFSGTTEPAPVDRNAQERVKAWWDLTPEDTKVCSTTPSIDISVCNDNENKVEECPRGHHKLEGDCRYEYCSCYCTRCKEQCERNR